ncbi:Eco57I restriction-modification methylase domain-containing protein [Streptomyces sp. NRRL F-5126]|uniref:Eco57I restriction-modification methylase domain-containing protein n=1 Tax=Streptomyces sp. NRRL F-5126 TaxID=1463857 RepID=UPI0004C6AE79|nr:type IIL restriction-modification enzyme MmeI [Streptomyces sp. NRRL F-5126]
MSTNQRKNTGRAGASGGSGRPRGGAPAPDGRQQHIDWLGLVDVSGPFLTLPVLLKTWPQLDSIDKPLRTRLRYEHGVWLSDTAAGQRAWTQFVLHELLGWGDALCEGAELAEALAVDVPEHGERIVPDFALLEPGSEAGDTAGLVADCAILGMTVAAGVHPAQRVPGSAWSATPVDRMAHLCRHHGVELGLVTDGRWWALVWAPRGGVTTSALFDTVAWTEPVERVVVRAFMSLLGRRRFFAVADDETLLPLLKESLDSQEDVTDALGVQVRRAVELLVEAIGRADVSERARGRKGLADVPARDVYRGAVAIMMRVVFLLFAEERGLLPSDNELYTQAYSAGRLCQELEDLARETTEDDLEQTGVGWHRLIALFNAVYGGVEHPALRMHAYDGSIFDPDAFPWLEGRGTAEGDPADPLPIDDRTVLHMLQSVQHVWIGTGRKRERRRLTFRTLDVEQIGYVYEGLLSYQGRRAEDTVVGLVGKPGLEAEVLLTRLESLARTHGDGDGDDGLAAVLAEEYNKATGLGSAGKVAKLLAPLGDTERAEARGKLLAATANDPALADRLLPFYRLIRPDLRGLPVVIAAGGLYVTESSLRKNTGTHYTPKSLAQQVADGALEPLVYEYGPLQTADRGQWRPKSSGDILKLKVADIAMGSAAFLVASCRYLAGALVEAWSREGDERAVAYLAGVESLSTSAVEAEDEPVMVEARRQIIEHCLYGVDINPMAVEMAKLSLWLVSMDRDRPFTFLDDRLVAGDSLLGITSVEQLESMHLDPVRGRRIHENSIDFTGGVGRLVSEVAEERRKLAGIPDTGLEALDEKRAMLASVREKTRRASVFADLVVGAALAGAGRGEKEQDRLSFAAVTAAHAVADAGDDGELAAAELERAGELARGWLATGKPEGAFEREPVHLPLVFPEVWDERGGFDAVVGNPPFLGGKKLTGSLGVAYREQLVEWLGRGARGNADLVAYFLLRAHELLCEIGQTGLIATNTLAQGDTREVGLDQLISAGVTVRQSVKSEPWPSKSVVLEYCAAWTSRAPVAKSVPRYADEILVRGINSSLDPVSRVSGPAERLVENKGVAFIGSYILGLGFTMGPDYARALMEKNERYGEVLFPYLNGQDLNSRPDASASRWVIDFHDWPEERARTYEDVFRIVENEVKPERRRRDVSGAYVLRHPLPERYWQYADKRPALQSSIIALSRVIVLAQVSKTLIPLMLPTGQVYSHKVVVFPSEDYGQMALLSSAVHYWWSIMRSATMKGDLSYSPSDVTSTFPRPKISTMLQATGVRLDTRRREIMLVRGGLTATYNLVHDESCTDADIAELREIHRAIDEEVAHAYGWDDLLAQPGGLDHGFHPTRQGPRYTVGPAVRQEILDRLLEENQRRYAAEVAAGLHDKKGAKKKAAAPARRKPKPPAEEPPSLF